MNLSKMCWFCHYFSIDSSVKNLPFWWFFLLILHTQKLFFFLLILRFCHLLYVCQLSLCTHEFWSFRPPALLLFQARVQSCLVSEHASCIHSDFFQGLTSSTHQHCLQGGHLWLELYGNFGVFIIQRSFSLCCASKGGGGGMQSWHSVTNRESFKIQQSTSPSIICSSPGRHRQDHSGVELGLCVYLSVCV